MKKEKNKYGQYFTPDKIAKFMISLISKPKSSTILEPSSGEGVFIEHLYDAGYQNISAYEIDSSINSRFDCVSYQDFINADINNKFDIIIGNPPYIRWRNLDSYLKENLKKNHLWHKYANSLCDYFYAFILKSISLLSDNGELIFICPEYWLSNTNAGKLRDYVIAQGYIEQIFFLNEYKIFDNVSSSLIIFKFIKSNDKTKDTKVFRASRTDDINRLLINNLLEDSTFYVAQPSKGKRWVFQHNEELQNARKLEKVCRMMNNTIAEEYLNIGSICNIGNGMVSGLDKAFQFQERIPLTQKEKKSIIKVAKAKHLKKFHIIDHIPYVLINNRISESEFDKDYPNVSAHLRFYKDKLELRYNYNKDLKFWEWAFLRNYALFNTNKKKIFIPCKERISHKNYFRFSLANEDIFPTQDVTAIYKKEQTKESIEYILAYLNLNIVFEWIKFNGINKGNIIEFSEKPISSIPYIAINWNDKIEVDNHQKITQLTEKYLNTKDDYLLSVINNIFNEIIERRIKNDMQL